jgi:hypothetical protein
MQMRPELEEEDEEDLSGPAEVDPEAEGAAIDMLLVGPAKGGPESAADADPQALVAEFEATLEKLKQLVAKMG